MGRKLGPTLSILVVEDDEAVAELIRTVLNDVTRRSYPWCSRS